MKRHALISLSVLALTSCIGVQATYNPPEPPKSNDANFASKPTSVQVTTEALSGIASFEKVVKRAKEAAAHVCNESQKLNVGDYLLKKVAEGLIKSVSSWWPKHSFTATLQCPDR